MKEIFVNLKRFDVPKSMGGICPTDDSKMWIENIMKEAVELGLGKLDCINVTFLLPESLIISAKEALSKYQKNDTKTINIGSQGVFRENVKVGGNFGAFTTNLPAAAVKSLGCIWSIIGHSEERKDKLGIIERFESFSDERVNTSEKAAKAVDSLVNDEVICALDSGINVLMCVGETGDERGSGSFEEQKPKIQKVLEIQLEMGLKGVEAYMANQKIVIGYEPIWAIGPGKTPPGAEYIEFVSIFIKSIVKEKFNFDPIVVYGGGLKEENASMIASIGTIGGGLVALTRFTGNIGFEVEDLVRIIEEYAKKKF